MPKTITIPQAVLTNAYDLTIDIQELTKLLLHHTAQESHEGADRVLPGHVTLLEIMVRQLDKLLDKLDCNGVGHA
ncbi:hypothetical protein [Maridesulfovibrio bastinii]|uniref:hypothetical protein n=1 Tax=Maridesulfovibrio bastinii TaxID=47157 RepID=UPI0003FBACED|nr:hypothetical protein [Maridesulfovibrio bastinii]